MKKRIFILVIITVFILGALTTYAAYIKDVPGTKSFTWYCHESLPGGMRSMATSAASSWNSANTGFTLTYSSTVKTGTINRGDTTSVVGFGDINAADPNIPADAGAVTYLATQTHRNFDIILNSRLIWSSGNSSSYYDGQGAFTHEFGHALGLADYNWGMGPYPWPYASQVYTMFGYLNYYGTPCSYYLRSVETQDINDAKYLASQVR